MINLTCIQCPRGCSLKVEKENNEYVVTGNFCPKGKEYALSEVIHPTRIITTTIRLEDDRVLPVKTSKPVDKNRMFEIMEKINKIRYSNLPVHIGDVICKNIDGDGVDLVASSNKNKL